MHTSIPYLRYFILYPQYITLIAFVFLFRFRFVVRELARFLCPTLQLNLNGGTYIYLLLPLRADVFILSLLKVFYTRPSSPHSVHIYYIIIICIRHVLIKAEINERRRSAHVTRTPDRGVYTRAALSGRLKRVVKIVVREIFEKNI